MKTNYVGLLVLAGMGFSQSGDVMAAKYACPVEKGAKCMSTAKVYEATNASADINGGKNEPLPPPPEVAAPKQVTTTTSSNAPRGTMVFVPAEAAALAVKGDSLSVVSPDRKVLQTTTVLPSPAIASEVPKTTITTNGYEPFREPAKIMQVYVAAWQDEYGDLHLSERIVTEIVPRKWSIGVKEAGSGDNYRLLEFPGAKTTDAQQSNDATKGAGK